ncbi:UxaA family hydrolase [Flagellimonas iocasae]|uniref:UxaA family hydrolase n=1 Tax=Flagellimonas iocasae TaxID=2055905 RepID=A0ABW4Y126_9FLAO
MNQNCLQIHPKDNIAVALRDIKKFSVLHINHIELEVKNDIRAKHKFALHDLKTGDEIIMYGVLVGVANQPISQGTAITVDNIGHAAGDYKPKQSTFVWNPPNINKWKNRAFMGYHRADGKVGTSNYWVVVPLTFCENNNLDIIKEAILEPLGYLPKRDFFINTKALVDSYKAGNSIQELLEKPIILDAEEMIENRVFPNVDGIKFLKHEGGCGGTREDAETLCNLLAGYITNPNVAGATILSLGCQNAQISMIREAISKRDPSFSKPIYILEQQQSKSVESFISESVKKTFMGMIEANTIEREPAPLSNLTVGLECGGSDGFSGISANPALGYASDILAALGGSPILAEFPELHGVEQDLINRCVSNKSAERFTSLIQTYSEKALNVGSSFEKNPSPGNIKDGLVTDAMKSAGAAKKGGTSPVTDVLDYTEPVTKPGLNLLCTPGNDVESTTALVGSGANIIVFTTGLGTPTGNPIAPVIKVSSNTSLAKKMKDIIDINAGTIISGEDSIETKGEEILEYIIQVASGKRVPKAVQLNQNDFIPWKRGISL